MEMTVAVKSLMVQRGERRVLDAMSFALAAGSVTAVLGPNGAGKTTLLKTLAGLLTPTAGAVTLVSEGDVHAMDAVARARLIGWSPPSAATAFPFLARETVVLGRFPWHGGRPRTEDLRRADEALAWLGVLDLGDRPVDELSSGEQQKVMLARLLGGDARLLLLDEPLANLDAQAALAFLALLKDLARRGKTIVLTMHDLGAAFRFADQALILKHGALVAAGAAKATLSPNTVRTVFGVESETVRMRDGGETLVIS